MNRMNHIAAATQIRLDTEGQAYYRRKQAAGKTQMQARRCLSGVSDAIYRQFVAGDQSSAGQPSGRPKPQDTSTPASSRTVTP